MPHLLLQASGKYTTASLEAESWTCTARVALVFGGGVDDVAPLPDWSPSVATEADIVTGRVTDANYNISEGGNVFSPTDFLHDQGEEAWKEMFIQAQMISSIAYIQRLSLYPIGTNGLTMSNGQAGVKAVASAVYDETYPGMHGTAATPNMPLTVSSCVSWSSRISGRKGRGRMYLPAIRGTVGSGVFNQADQIDFADAGQRFGNALKLSAAGYSTALIVTGHPWTDYGRVVSVRAGKIPDTQRRRDAQLNEEYVTRSIA